MTYSLDIINLAITHLIQNKSKIEISKYLNITRQTIHGWYKKYNNNIINMIPVTDIQLNKNIHKNNKINNYLSVINNYVESNSGCSLNDIHLNIKKEISKTSIINILKKLNITHKRINNHIICKDPGKIIDERKLFVDNLNFNINDAIYIDESSFCVNQVVNYGYSKKGVEINKLIRHKHNKERYTLLAAISNTKIVNFKIIKESVNAPIYLDFIKTNNENFKNKILIQDNARIHHALIVKNYASSENIKLKYNPAYTPEFNPIELMFNKCKIEFKKLDHTNIVNDINDTLNKITLNDCQQFYNHVNTILNTYKTNNI